LLTLYIFRVAPKVPPTLETIAAEAGVSKATVMYVLNGNKTISDSTRAKVMRIVQAHGFRPSASHLVVDPPSRSRVVCVLVPELGKLFRDPYFSQAVDGIYDELEAADYRMILRKVTYDFAREKEYLSLFRKSEVAGMLYVGSTLEDRYLADIAGTEFPFLFVGSRLPDIPLSNVRADNVEAGRKMTHHLIALGHRRIATITGSLNTTSALERLEGYRIALAKAGIPHDENLVRQGNFSPIEAIAAAKVLIKLDPRPTAIYVGNDTMAIAVLEFLAREKIKVPDEIAIVGTDNIERSRYCHPALTTVDTAVYDVGRAATRHLLKLIEGDEFTPRQYEIVPVRAVIRSSCGAERFGATTPSRGES
jgi:DNA-binding LacI/PurR family transcriptional regulator